MRAVLALALIATPILSGCIAPEVGLESASAIAFSCETLREELRCDGIEVRVVNKDRGEEASLSRGNWELVDEDGGIHDPRFVRGASAASPGATVSVTIEVEIPWSTNITSVVYDPLWGSPVSVGVEYDW